MTFLVKIYITLCIGMYEYIHTNLPLHKKSYKQIKIWVGLYFYVNSNWLGRELWMLSIFLFLLICFKCFSNSEHVVCVKKLYLFFKF